MSPILTLRQWKRWLTPTKLWTRTEVLARPCPVPGSAGVYAWFFDSCPQGVPTEGLVRSVGLALLYVGISPKPPSNVGIPSRQTLRSRLRYHFQGNAEGSTLRLSLGCLLSQDLGIQLPSQGRSARATGAQGRVGAQAQAPVESREAGRDAEGEGGTIAQ